MTREEAGRRGREIAARARAQKSEYYTDGNTVRHIKPQNRVINPYISKDKNKNKDKYNSRSEMRHPERNTSARKRIDFQIEKHRIEERKKQQKIEQQRQQKERRREKQQAKEQAFINRERQQKANRKRTSAATISRNRQNATQMQRGFVVFLMIASIAVLFSCIHYLQLKSELTYKMQTVANLESELEELRNYNDAYENEVLNSVDLEEIKQKAIGKLWMKYPDAEHVQEYDANSKGYMRQYKIVGEEE